MLGNILSVENQKLLEKSASTELKKFCFQHAAIDLLLLSLQRLNLCLDQLVLALRVVGEGVVLALSKNYNLLHRLMVSHCLGQEHVEQICQLMRITWQIFIVLWHQRAERLHQATLQDAADQEIRVLAALAKHGEQLRDGQLSVGGGYTVTPGPSSVDHRGASIVHSHVFATISFWWAGICFYLSVISDHREHCRNQARIHDLLISFFELREAL